MTVGMPMERNLCASANALGAVEVIDEMPMRSAPFRISQFGSEMSSIKAWA